MAVLLKRNIIIHLVSRSYTKLLTSVMLNRPHVSISLEIHEKWNFHCQTHVCVSKESWFSLLVTHQLFSSFLSYEHTHSFVFGTQHLARSNLRLFTLSLKLDSMGSDSTIQALIHRSTQTNSACHIMRRVEETFCLGPLLLCRPWQQPPWLSPEG